MQLDYLFRAWRCDVWRLYRCSNRDRPLDILVLSVTYLLVDRRTGTSYYTFQISHAVWDIEKQSILFVCFEPASFHFTSLIVDSACLLISAPVVTHSLQVRWLLWVKYWGQRSSCMKALISELIIVLAEVHLDASYDSGDSNFLPSLNTCFRGCLTELQCFSIAASATETHFPVTSGAFYQFRSACLDVETGHRICSCSQH